MELELGLKITRTREDVSSSVDFRFSKDPFGPLVLSQETNSRFIIIIHLKGFKKEGIEIDINKEGNRITIEGRKPVEEMVMIRWMAWRKEVEFRVFKKVFRIPDFVDLDKIKATFDDDDATLTVTMPKRVKGISGSKIEEEEGEERVDFADVSEAGEVEDGSVEREESDQHSETEIQREEEFRERESQVLGEEQKDDDLDKIHQTHEQETISLQELADSNRESENGSLRKLPDIEERDSYEPSKSDDFGTRAFEEIKKQEPDEQLDRTSGSGATEKRTTDDDGDGLSKVQGIEEPERHNEESKIQEILERETSGHEKKKIVKMEVKNRDAKEEVDVKMGQGCRPNIDRAQVVGGDDIAETETKADKVEADEVDKTHELVEKKEEKRENGTMRRQIEDRSLIKLQENEEQDSKGQKPHREQENIQELVEEKAPEVETKIENDIQKPVQEIEVPELDTLGKTDDEGKERKEKQNIVKKEIKNGDAKEEVDAKMGEGFSFAPKVAETETKAEECKSDKLESDEVDKIQKLAEKKEEEEKNAKVGRQSEDINLVKPQEIGQQQFQGQKRHDKHEKIKELVEEQPKETETNIGNDITKPVQEIGVPEVDTLGKTGGEGKEGNEKKQIVKMEIKNGDAKEKTDGEMGKRFTPSVAETATKAEDFEYDKLESADGDKIQKLVEKKEEEEENAKVGAQSENIRLTKLQEIGQHQFQGQKRHGKQEKIDELVEDQTPEAEKHIRNDTPNQEKRDKLFPEETENQPEEYKEKIMDTVNDAGVRKVQDISRQQVLDEPARCEKESKTQELVKRKTNDEEKEEKEIAETETKEQESYRPKIFGEQEMIQELAEEKTNFSKNEKFREDKKIAEKNTEFGHDDDDDDDISRKVQDVEQRDSDAMKGQEEKYMIQELVLEEKVSDDGKGIIAVAETKAEIDKSKRVQEIDEQQSHEGDTCGKQEKLIGGKTSGRGEVEVVENKKKTTETEKRIQDRRKEAQEIERKDSDVSGKYIKGTIIQENEENLGIDRNEHEEEKQEEADRPEKITGTIRQELVQFEQDNVEDGEKTQEPVKEKIKDCKEEEGSEESKTKTDDDDVVRKVPGINEQELYEPTRGHVSKIKELVKEKTGDHEKQQEKEIAEPEIEAECGSLRKVDGIEELDLHEPKIHKECDKTRITGEEEPSGQAEEKVVESMTTVGGENYSEEQELHEPNVHKERDKTRITEAVEPSGEEKEKIVEPMTIAEKENSVDVQEIKKERPDKPESHEKRYKIQEVVEAEHNDQKEEQQEEKVMDKAKQDNKEESSKKIQEVEQQEHDELKRSMIQDKMQETEEKDRTRAKEENEIVERTKTKEASLRNVRDDENSELRKPYKRQKEDTIQELVELGTSDYREKVKKQDEDDILKSQEDLDEFEKHGEQRNIPQLMGEDKVENIADLGGPMEDDSSGKFHESEDGKSDEDWTQEEREKKKDLVKEEANDPKDKHTGGENHNDHKEEEQEEKVIAKAGLKTEEDSSKKVQEIEKQEYEELKRSMVQDKMHETEKKDKTRAMDENEIVERRPKTKDGSLRKIPEGEDPELSKQKRHGKEDMIQELVEAEINDHRGKVKKKDGDDILRSQETGKLDLGERERHSKQRKIHQSVEDKKGEGIMEKISEPDGKMKGDSSDKFHGFQKQKSYEDWKQEESEEIKSLVKDEATDPKDKHTRGEGERYEKVAEPKTKVGNENKKKVGEDKKEPESDKQERYGKLDKSEGVLLIEGTSDREKEEENLVDDFTTKIQETEKEKLHEFEMHEKQAIVPDIVEDDTGDQEDEEIEGAAAVVASNENGSSRKVQKIEEEEQEESEKQKEQNTIPETSDPDVKEEDEERVAEKETKEEAPNTRSIRETKELEAHHVHELEGKTENCKDDDGEGRRGENGKQGKTVETMSHERFMSKSDDSIMRKIPATKVQEPNEKKNQERKGKIEELKRNESSNHEVKLMTEDESLRKGQDFLEKESTVSKRRPVEQEKIQELEEVKKRDRVNEDEEKAKAETKFNEGKSRKFEMSKRLELDESEFNEEQKKILKPLEENSNASKKIAEEEMQDMVDSRVKEQEIRGEDPYELLKHGEHDKIPDYHKEKEKGMKQREIEEMKRTTDDVSSRKVQQIKDELEKHQKPSEMPEKHNIQESVEKTSQERGEEELNEGRKYKAVLKTETVDLSKSQDVEEKRSDQPERYAVQELMTEEDGKEEYHIREGEQNKKAKRILQLESKANGDSLEKNKSEGHGSTGLREQSDDKEAKEGNRAGAVWREGETQIRDDDFGKVRKSEELDKKKSFVVKDTGGKAEENMIQETKRRDDSSGNKTQENKKQESHEQKKNEEEVVGKAETIDEYDSSRKIHEHEERKSDEMSEKIAEEETRDDKEAREGNRAGAVLGEVQTKIGKVRETEEQEQDKKQSLEADTSGKAKVNKNQETKSRDASSRKKTLENEIQESHEQKINDEREKKNLGLVGKKTNCYRNEEEDKETAEVEVPRKLKGIDKKESTKMVERHTNQDNIHELVEEKLNNQEGEDKKSMITEVLKHAEDGESIGPEALRKQDKSSEQRLRDIPKDEEIAKTVTKNKDNEPREIHQIKEKDTSKQERLKEQGRIKELVEDRTPFCRKQENRETEFEDGSSKTIQELDKEESNEPGRDEKGNKIQELVDRETSDNDEEELEIEFEDEEEDWEAEVIQETDSDEDNDKIRQIKRIRLGFRLVGGSTLFMSLIVIVISFIRSKRKIRCYKF